MLVDRLRAILDPLAGEVPLAVEGHGSLPSAFPVTELLTASTASAGAAAAHLAATLGGPAPVVHVDRRLASAWAAASIVPDGWAVPSPWEALAGDYRGRDGAWIRLHTNAPRHRRAALVALGLGAEVDRDTVAVEVARWDVNELEAAVVGAGGCAAAMRTAAEWDDHPQGRAVAGEPVVDVIDVGPSAAPDRAAGATPDRPLAGVRVLDLTRVLAGPVATRFLAGLGADVLRIDPPDWDEPGVVPEVTLGKRCARIDARTPDGAGRLRDLVAGADLLVHGYRPGALAALGLDEAALAELRPGLVQVTLDAYGWTGPWAGRRGFDSLVQMSAGLAAEGQRSRGADRPVPLPVQALDHAAGHLLAAAAVRAWRRVVLDGRATRSRTSLARVARVLVDAGRAAPEVASWSHELAPVGPADLADGTEPTAWGPARRLRPPVWTDRHDVQRWVLPASPLGSWAGGPRW